MMSRCMDTRSRSKSAEWPRLALGLIALLTMWFAGGQVFACSVPVFRYALERWTPDHYSVAVFHRGELSEGDRQLVSRLDSETLASEEFVNLSVNTVDLSSNPEPHAVELWKSQNTETLPWVMVLPPWTNLGQSSPWSGPLDEAAVGRLVDSPVRREVARRLLKGETAVWVLLESGDADQDQAAFDRLNTRLNHLETALELPELAPEDIEEGLITIDEDELRIDFSTIRISRNDPAEEFFINMLLNSEDDLKDFDDPMAFPIFGRGRVLYALIGDGISADVIDEACVFLTGECSCEVKEQNPGVDLVMAVNWDALVERQYDVDRELPPLSGFVGFSNEGGDSEDVAETERLSDEASVALGGNVVEESGLDATPKEVSSFVSVSFIAVGILFVGVMLVGWFFVRGGAGGF